MNFLNNNPARWFLIKAAFWGSLTLAGFILLLVVAISSDKKAVVIPTTVTDVTSLILKCADYSYSMPATTWLKQPFNSDKFQLCVIENGYNIVESTKDATK